MIVDISETALDSFLEDDITKDFPIFGLLFKGKNLISTIQDKLFLKKLLKFLKQLEDTTPEERREQINEIEENQL